MNFFVFVSLLVLSAAYSLPVATNKSIDLESQSKIVKVLRDRRSPVPDPHHHRNKIHAHVHIHGHYSEPSYYAKPVPVIQPVVAQPVQVVAQPVSGGCSVCGGGGYGGGGYGGGSHSQASSQASSSSFSTGFNSPFGNLGFSGSSAQSSAQAGSAGYGK